MAFYFCRLLPPRPTFARDLSDAERAVMGAHAQYLRGKLAEKKVIAFGPVDDPSGSFGAAFVEVADADELAALLAGDPAIQSGMGLRYETAPMFALVHGGAA